jgi:hypothetical protein
MKRIPYCCDASQHLFDQYYSQQQKGGGFPVYVGRLKQRGHGLSDIFKTIWQYIFPAIKTIAPHALRAGANIVDDVSSGNSWAGSAMRHGKDVVRQIPEAISASFAAKKNQSGSGASRRKVAKRRKRDIFS